ncbi:MAG: M20/M25/M40 family metallo-hydrolase [Clostridia bacterium]|nr:M20/M25/M40 family metallo-hydrolase [Clostridia bacterium]
MFVQLKKFMMADGVSGDEKNVSAVIAAEIAPYVDEVYSDAMGNLIALKKGRGENPKKLMLAAHMDEIGFMVNYIDDRGYLRVSKMGGIMFNAAAYAEVVFASGLKGVLVPEPTVPASDYKSANVYVDIGAKNKKDAERRVKIGDTCRLSPSLTKLLNGRVYGRPIDDRIGCLMLFEAAKSAKRFENDTYFVFTVQEEVGVRGAKTSAFAIMPDYAVAVDIGGSGDIPGCKPFAVNLGEGIAIKLKDSMVISHKTMVDLMKKLADDNKVPYQFEILEKGGTDTGVMQQAGGGCIAGALSVPTRYGHTGVETIDMNDVTGGVRILAALCETKLA